MKDRLINAYRTMPAGVFYIQFFAFLWTLVIGIIVFSRPAPIELAFLGFVIGGLPSIPALLAPRKKWGQFLLLPMLLFSLVTCAFFFHGIWFGYLLTRPGVAEWWAGEELPANAKRPTPVGLVITSLMFIILVPVTLARVTAPSDDVNDPEINELELGTPGEWEVVSSLGPQHAGKTVPALVWLHGYGANPQNTADRMREILGESDVVVVGVSATNTLSERSYSWQEDVEVDTRHVRERLDAVEKDYDVNLDPIVAIGFSQGAALAARMLATDVKWVDGAIIMSPGHLSEWPLPAAEGPPSGKRAVVLVNELENEYNVVLSKEMHSHLGAIGIESELRIAEGEERHTYPPDFGERLEDWVDFVINGKPAE